MNLDKALSVATELEDREILFAVAVWEQKPWIVVSDGVGRLA